MAISARFDPQPPDRGSGMSNRETSKPPPDTNAAAAGAPEQVNLLALMGRAEQISREYQAKTVQQPLSRSLRAWQNQHAENSKYLGTAFKGRSRLFVPKTRAAVRKNLATAAAALFSTEDVVNISAEYEDDPVQRASAAVLKADMDYRLTRSSSTSGLPWFMIAMGGCLDGQLTGVTISKQYWEYVEVPSQETEIAIVPAVDEETGETLVHPETNEVIEVEVEVPVMRAVKDRPMCDLFPCENAIVDPAAPWYAVVQGGRWWGMRYAMGLSDVRAMMASPGKGGLGTEWLQVTDEVLLKGRVEEERSGTRRVREGGSDRYEDAKGTGDLDIVWLQENFLRISGIDYHFWSVGRHAYLSTVQETRVSYPHAGGERPYVMGVAQIDTHRVFPQSPAETWQPLQLELNDVANLRLDTLKRSIAPLAVVKKGRNVDLAALQRRGQPEAVVLVEDPNDISFASTPGPTGAAYTETSVTNAMFDELAGVFSTSSVQMSRQLNETVGGMRLMNGSANAVSEFDLRMWIETWVEPVLRQLVHLVRHHESDAKILAIAGQKARVLKQFGLIPTLDEFEAVEVTLRVNAGIGALDPMQKIGKLKMAFEMLAPMLAEMRMQGIVPNVEALIEEIMGAAGFRDGRRFFTFGPPKEVPPDPKVVEAMENAKVEQDKIALERDRLAIERETALFKLLADGKQGALDNRTKLAVEGMRGRSRILEQAVDIMAGREQRTFDARMGERRAAGDRRARLEQLFTQRALQPPKTAVGGPRAASAGSQPPVANAQGTQGFNPQLVMMQRLMEQVAAVAERANRQDQMLQRLVAHLAPPRATGASPNQTFA